MELVRERPWSTVWRDHDRWVKRCAPHEVALTAALARRWPDRLPVVLEAEGDRLVIADAGEQAVDWRELMPRYAELQQGETEHADEHLANGVPDFRPQLLDHQYVHWAQGEPRLEPYVHRFTELCDSLTRAPTIQHDDLHDGNVFVRDDRQLLLDWGDAIISHPFFTLSVMLEGQVAWGLDDVEDSVDIEPLVDRYLRRYDPDRPELRGAFPLALRLGWACRAVNGTVAEDPESTRNRLRMFLDGKP